MVVPVDGPMSSYPQYPLFSHHIIYLVQIKIIKYAVHVIGSMVINLIIMEKKVSSDK